MATPAHLKQGEDGTRRRSGLIAASIVAAVVVVAAGVAGAIALTSHPSNGSSQVAERGGQNATNASSSAPASTTTTQAPPPLAIRSLTPAASATGVATDSAISITFSHPLTATSPTPTLTPAVLGHWTRKGASLSFQPTAGYIPSTQVTVKVPSTTTTLEDRRSIQLGHDYQMSFTVGTGSTVRLQQLLAQLGYLPLNFTPTPPPAPPTTTTTTTPPTTTPSTTAPAAPTTTTHAATTTAAVSTSALSSEPATADAVSTNPVPGTFAWQYPDTPASLQAQWGPGYNLITQGAVMAFEGNHDLAVDGVAGSEVWTALLNAVAARQVDPRPYSYIMVNEEGIEYLRVWQAGTIVYESPANTGVPGAATQQGTFAVYTHLTSTTMTGTDVDGTKYVDPGIPYVAYFNGGDAIHGYPRASYGFPQSNGCVELPIANAGQVFNSGEDWYGTLVTVS